MMFAVLGEVSQTHLKGNFCVTENSQKVRHKSLYKIENPTQIAFIPGGLVHVFLCNFSHFLILVKSFSLLIKAQPAEEFCFSFHHWKGKKESI